MKLVEWRHVLRDIRLEGPHTLLETKLFWLVCGYFNSDIAGAR